MWCLVRLPNCVVVDVGVDSKAAGQEVLDRVSIDFFSVILLRANRFCFAIVTDLFAVIITI